MRIAEKDDYVLMLLNPADDDFEDSLEKSMVHLDRAIPFITGQTTKADILKKIRGRQCLVFNAYLEGEMVASVLVTMFKRKDGLACNIELTGGDETHYKNFRMEFITAIEKHMKACHVAKHSRIIGRPAWWRISKEWGYTPTHFFAEKTL